MSERKQTLRLRALAERKKLDKNRFSALKNKSSLFNVWPLTSIGEAHSVRSRKTRLSTGEDATEVTAWPG